MKKEKKLRLKLNQTKRRIYGDLASVADSMIQPSVADSSFQPQNDFVLMADMPIGEIEEVEEEAKMEDP